MQMLINSRQSDHDFINEAPVTSFGVFCGIKSVQLARLL